VTRGKSSWEHKDWREEVMRRTQKDFGLECCCLVVAGSQTHRQDQTFGGLEVAADTRLYGQAAAASQQQQAYRGKLVGSKFEGRMAVVVSRQVSRRA
jgi:hypothetical protein